MRLLETIMTLLSSREKAGSDCPSWARMFMVRRPIAGVSYGPLPDCYDRQRLSLARPAQAALSRIDYELHMAKSSSPEDSLAVAKYADAILVTYAKLTRGPLIDEPALLAALDSGQVGGAALDVITTEPMPKDSPLLGRDNLILTPHPRSIRSRRSMSFRPSAPATSRGAEREGCLSDPRMIQKSGAPFWTRPCT